MTFSVGFSSYQVMLLACKISQLSIFHVPADISSDEYTCVVRSTRSNPTRTLSLRMHAKMRPKDEDSVGANQSQHLLSADLPHHLASTLSVIKLYVYF